MWQLSRKCFSNAKLMKQLRQHVCGCTNFRNFRNPFCWSTKFRVCVAGAFVVSCKTPPNMTLNFGAEQKGENICRSRWQFRCFRQSTTQAICRVLLLNHFWWRYITEIELQARSNDDGHNLIRFLNNSVYQAMFKTNHLEKWFQLFDWKLNFKWIFESLNFRWHLKTSFLNSRNELP